MKKIGKMFANILLNRYYLLGFFIFSSVYLNLILRSVWPELYKTLVFSTSPNIVLVWTAIILVHDIVKKKLDLSKEMILLWLYMIVAFISSYLSYFGFGLVYNLGTQVTFSYIFYTLLHFSSEEEWKKYFHKYAKHFIYVVLIISILSIVFYYTKWTITLPNGHVLDYGNEFFGKHYKSDKVRYIGMLDDVLPGSMRACTAILFGFFLLENKQIPSWLQIVNVLVHTWIIYMTDTRMSLLVLAATLAIAFAVFLQKKIGKKKAYLVMGGLLLFGIIGYVVFNNDKLVTMWNHILENPFHELSRISSGRGYIWEACIQEFLKHPILGIGFTNAEPAYRVGYTGVHNVFIAVLLYTGSVGGIIALAFIVVSLKSILKRRKDLIANGNRWILVTVVLILFMGMLENLILGEIFHVESGIFWWLLGYITFYKAPQKNNVV